MQLVGTILLPEESLDGNPVRSGPASLGRSCYLYASPGAGAAAAPGAVLMVVCNLVVRHSRAVAMAKAIASAVTAEQVGACMRPAHHQCILLAGGVFLARRYVAHGP